MCDYFTDDTKGYSLALSAQFGRSESPGNKQPKKRKEPPNLSTTLDPSWQKLFRIPLVNFLNNPEGMHREAAGIFAVLAVRTLPNATKSLKLPINKVIILGRSQSNCDSGGSTIMYPRDTQKATYGSLLFLP